MASWQSLICALLMALCLFVSCAAVDNSGSRRELTTRSWDVLGFHEDIVRSPTEDQIIIAVIDGGIWPESPSFSDKGLGPPPAKWKGVCDVGNSRIPFKCNNKIIGARWYTSKRIALPENEDLSPRDTHGHGTHVAATVAGVVVRNVSIQGIGLGTTRGAVPRARLAIYKACWGACYFTYRALYDAVRDGADIISMSIITSIGALRYGSDDGAIPSFQAMKAGQFLSFCAGNNGSLARYTVTNAEPWITTVGNSAGSGTDYITHVTLGDGKQFEGVFLNSVDNGKIMHPLVRNEEVTNATDPEQVRICIPENMNPESVKGKIILCEKMPRRAIWDYDHLGCAGLLFKVNESRYFDFKDHAHYQPVTAAPIIGLHEKDFQYLSDYYKNSNSTGKPATASIAKTISAPDSAPRSGFSSNRGPNLADLNILKPDISAPGVNQIDAIHGDNPGYGIMTGTSMSAPFLSGVAAYIKSFHPTWSPAAIKSAMMTTARPMTDPYKNQAELAFGAGEINPVQVMDPGLVYDIGEAEYVKYLCQLSNSNNQFMLNVTGDKSIDCAKIPVEKGWTLNYPSFAVPTFLDQPFVSVFQRTLTNVGNSSTSNYKAVVSAPKELTVKVEPSVLAFTQVGQALSYTLTVSGTLVKSNDSVADPVISASIVWTDGSHHVRSPIIVFERPVDPYVQFVKTSGYEITW